MSLRGWLVMHLAFVREASESWLPLPVNISSTNLSLGHSIIVSGGHHSW